VQKTIGALAAVVLASVVVVAAAVAAKPGSGSSTGVGSVFVSNPVQSLGDETLTDQKDSDAAVPSSAYYRVGLTNLDGSGFLRGDYATVISETGNPAYSPTNTFVYTRHQDEFEQVMAYYWITQAQTYIHSLGFGVTRRPVNNRPQPVRIDQWGLDNSFATDAPKNELRFGKGGVDDAEDAEVILHEYGHAIHFSQNFDFGGDGGAISEGFGDYWAADVTNIVAPTPDPACVADWDSVSYTPGPVHCLRRVDTNLHYPGDLSGEVHHDGQMWSRALWDIRTALGHTTADTIILQAQFDFPGTSMADLARRTVDTAQQLYGTKAAKAVTAAFQARGIL
jgi:zinc metalloprotease ZmpB